ncbi:MAG: hypothetical protein J7497_16005 [Chitinophagaceae bacterium]|nr:hypothetical protein [Chitinophagaceae bacterium]
MQKKPFLLTLILSVVFSSAFTQYYYRDLILTRQTFGLFQRLKEAGIKSVSLSSFEGNGQPTEGFKGGQEINNNYTQMNTSLESVVGGASLLISYFDSEGLLVKTIDTTDGASSLTEYFYSPKKQVLRIVNTATSKGQATEKEEHIWTYGTEGKPVKMFRVKNNTDTTLVSFILDEQGNIAEEKSVRKGFSLPSIYYYHDNEHRLTDIVTYNEKARRLLPVYIFDYNDMGLINSMLVVPEGSSDYQKWVYSYNDDGLKTEEKGYNKKKELVGRIEYRYDK